MGLGTIRRVIEQTIGMHDVFVGVEHRLRDAVSKRVWINFTTLHTSGGEFVAAANHLVSGVDASGCKVEGLEGNEG